MYLKKKKCRVKFKTVALKLNPFVCACMSNLAKTVSFISAVYIM